MNSKLENYKYRFLIGIFTATGCIAASYTTVYLTNHGVADYEAGIIIAIANIIATLVSPILGRIADKSKRWTSKCQVIIIITIQIIISFGLAFINSRLVISILFCFLVTNIFLASPLMYSMSFQYEQNKINIDFGIASGFGALFFALASFALGKFTAQWGSDIIPAASIILNILVLILAIRILPNESIFGIKERKFSDNKKQEVKGGAFIKKYPLFFVMILGIIFIMFFHNMTMFFFIRIVENIGCGSNEMGIAVGISAILEIPTMFMFTRINKKIKTSTLLLISGASFLLKGVLYCAAGEIWVIYLAQCLNITAFGLMESARVYYSHEMVDEEYEVTGQAFMNATDTVSCVLGSTIGGLLMSFSGGINAVLALGTGVCFVGVLIVAGCVFFAHKK